MAVPWTLAEPDHLVREWDAVRRIAPDLVWTTDLESTSRGGLVGWTGQLPQWPAARPIPAGVEALLGSARAEVIVRYREATPTVPPVIVPVYPEVPLTRRTLHDWHVNGDGSLCLLASADDWVMGATAADLIVKAACWFVEYRLMEGGLIPAMSPRGLAEDDTYDDVLGRLAS